MTAHANDLAVDVRGLRKQYGDVTAVGGIDLGIRAGEVFGLLGPNGAGKSTTVEILQGHRDRDGGEVRVLGADPATGTRAWRSRVGIVWQDESAPAELTVRETVRHFARHYPRPRDPEQVIALVGLEAKADSRTKTLSGGQRRRLDVALGVIGGPELLLLDEPTTGFDPAARRQFWELIRSLADEGTTILLTTHYLEEAEALADRLAVVAGGRVVAEGEPAAPRERYGSGATVAWTEPDGTVRSTHTDDRPARARGHAPWTCRERRPATGCDGPACPVPGRSPPAIAHWSRTSRQGPPSAFTGAGAQKPCAPAPRITSVETRTSPRTWARGCFESPVRVP